MLFLMEVMVVGDLNLMISNFNNMKISPYEEGLKVKDKQTIPVSDDKLTLAGRTKTSY